MANSTQDNSNKVSLEELLRFKRAERPDEVFWERFDHELHQRMMQTLVKKDPWYAQIMRGLTGKIAQTTAVAAAAAVLALMVIRPAFIAPAEQSRPSSATLAGISEEVEMPDSAEAALGRVDPVLMAQADYKIDMLTTAAAESSNTVTPEYGLDHLDMASYDRSAYSADMALSGFTAAGVASIVY